MPTNSISNPKYKDSVFRMLFNNKKELLSLYNAINGSHHDNPDDITINTIGDSTFLKVKNDVSFIFNYELNVFEHQSTPCPNMPLRDLFYVAKLLKKITQEDDLYSSKPVKIPTPKFYVFYNGTELLPDEKIYRLSEQFEKQTATPDIELTVTVLNINEGNNQKLMEACDTLKSYSIFVSLVRKYIKEIPKDTDDKEEEIKAAINHAIQDCIDQNILKAFFEKHRREVRDMTYWDYNEELHNKTIATEATEKAALEMIRFGREESIQDDKTRLRIKNLGLSDGTIDELFAQVDAENATLVP